MPYGEADTRAKLIDPAIRACGWTEDHIFREVTAGGIEIDRGKARRGPGRIDYVLRVQVTRDTQPVALALIEAKAESLPPGHGMEQAKEYARRLHVPFVFSSNGHQFVEYDNFTGLTCLPRPLAEFPAPADLRRRYEAGQGFSLSSPAARPLLTRYRRGEGNRRYYQDAAIRAVLEKLARGEKRALLSLATGSGKTYIAVNLLRKLADAGQLRRALFLCDRDELRAQGLAALQNVFGADAAAATTANPEKNARIVVATYQTLGVDGENGDPSYLRTHYPPNYFSHIVIDECHRSAWGKWSEVLTRNPDAVQIGLTATPRQLEIKRDSREARDDAQVTADNLKWFGEPVYEYSITQGIEDGYLAACEVVRFDIHLEEKPADERVTGVERADLIDKRVSDALTGEIVAVAEVRDHYDASNLEDVLQSDERVAAMCATLFAYLLASGGPEQKTIIFCARDSHADRVAAEMGNLYADWCRAQGRAEAASYAFKCTAAGGSGYVAELRGASRSHFVACTVDLLTTGVDVPPVRNIVFFKYVRSPIAFYQMIGRGTRIHDPSAKLMFRVYDFTDATRLFPMGFFTPARTARAAQPAEAAGDGREPERILRVEGMEVHVNDAGHSILTEVGGQVQLVSVEEYRHMLAERLVAQAATVNEFRRIWVQPEARRALLVNLPEGGRSVHVLRAVEEMSDYDLFDVLAEVGYGLAPKRRQERAESFAYKQQDWLAGLPAQAAAVVQAVARQFARGGTESLENQYIFALPDVKRAGGLAALKAAGRPAELVEETKVRMFAA